MEQVVRELKAGFPVAVKAVGPKLTARHHLWIAAFPEKHLVAVVFAVCQTDLPPPPLVKLAVRADHDAHELGNRLRHQICRDLGGPKRIEEALRIIRLRVVVLQTVDGLGPRQVHLVRVGDGLEDLFFEGERPAVPEVRRRPTHVDQGHGIAGADGAGDSGAVRFWIRKADLRKVTRATRHGVVFAEPGFPKQHASQPHPFFRQRVVGRDVHRREKRRNLKGVGRRIPHRLRAVTITSHQGQAAEKEAQKEVG